MIYSKQYFEAINKIFDRIPNLNKLKNSSILITGAGGLIGSAIADFLLYINSRSNFNCKVYLAGRSKNRIENRFKIYTNQSDYYFLKYDANKPIGFAEQVEYVIHTANNATPKLYVDKPVDTMMGIYIGTANILNYAVINKVNRVLYISSSEVYGTRNSNQPYVEDEYGFVDILNCRACYPSAKRSAETLCAAFAAEYNLDFVIARPGHVYGPTMTDQDNRASSQFPRDVLAGKNIIMKSNGAQLRSYCYIMDCISAIFTILLNGNKGEAYNISNPDSICTIRELAELIADYAGQEVQFENPSDKEKASYNLMDNSSLDSNKLESLGWSGAFSIHDGIRSMMDIMMN